MTRRVFFTSSYRKAAISAGEEAAFTIFTTDVFGNQITVGGVVFSISGVPNTAGSCIHTQFRFAICCFPPHDCIPPRCCQLR